jgi:spore coat polysaccharide biosynthesis protein SpsF
MTSTRLPGKVMARVRGVTLLERLLNRLSWVRTPHRTIVATTANRTDDVIVAEAARLGVTAYRGSEDDVLSRFAEAAREHGGEVIVRVTSDCPLMDPAIADEVVRAFFTAPKVDYASNTVGRRTFPRGLDVEVFSRQALDTADRDAHDPTDREHVTPFIYRNPDRFSLRSVAQAEDHSAHRWTVDTVEDLRLVIAIVEALEPTNPSFGMRDILDLLARNPELMDINRHVRQKPLVS